MNQEAVGMSKLRQQGMSALVLVDDARIRTPRAAKPPVGARLDVGFPVVVVQTKDVAGAALPSRWTGRIIACQLISLLLS